MLAITTTPDERLTPARRAKLAYIYVRQSSVTHAKPSGQRRLNKNAAHTSSSGNDFWNSASDRPLATHAVPHDRLQPARRILHLARPESTA